MVNFLEKKKGILLIWWLYLQTNSCQFLWSCFQWRIRVMCLWFVRYLKEWWPHAERYVKDLYQQQKGEWGASCLFFLRNINFGSEHLLRISCSCGALWGINKSSTWIILSSSCPPSYSYSLCWFCCRHNDFYQKSLEEMEMAWDFKLLSSLCLVLVWLSCFMTLLCGRNCYSLC